MALEKGNRSVSVGKNGWKARFMRRYGMSPITGGNERITLVGKRRACVYGCRRILYYSPSEIRLLLAKDELSVLGRGLFCSSFSAGTVTVEGEIGGILYGSLRSAMQRESEGNG